ncbi:MAG: glycosyltransferase [Nitrospirales bacterium]|nr:glycosyltransferase [Nitrospira sp.]MDR4502370.1 glycosyltransferase [Nitrospirales bacterium]
MSLLQENLEIVRLHDPQLAQQLLVERGGALKVEDAKNGMLTAKAGGQWIHSAYDPLKEANTWAEGVVAKIQPDEIPLIMGVGLLYHVEALQQQIAHATSILVLVPDLRELYDALSVRALGRWGERIQWLWGESQDVAASVSQTHARLHLIRHEPSSALHEEYIRTFQQHLRERVSHERGGRLHVAVVGPIYGGSLSVAHHVVAALEHLGHRVSWIDHSLHYPGYKSLENLRDPQLRLTMQSRFGETLGVVSLAHIADDPPDLVLAMAQAPLSMPVLEQLRKKKVLTAMWFVENFRHFTYWQQVAAGYEFWFVMQQKPCIDALSHAGARHVSYLPLAANPEIHRPLVCSPDEEAEFGADVSFLGAGYPNRRFLLQALLHQGWSFKIWGNEWEKAGPLEAVLQRNGARIDSDTSVKIFNCTKVNINLHSYTGEGFDPDGDSLNPRMFELAACGAFQVSDARSLLWEHFDDTMLAVIKRPEELVTTVTQYLADPHARQSMADASRSHVLRHHTYVHRMETLLREVGLHQPDRVGAVLRGERNASSLIVKSQASPELIPLLRPFRAEERVELSDVAANIRAKGPTAVLSREELLVLMMDEYRQETRDFV